MVVFEGKAFDEKAVVSIESTAIHHPKTKAIDTIVHVHFRPGTMQNNVTVSFEYLNQDNGISKVNEIATLINNREEELLKLTNS